MSIFCYFVHNFKILFTSSFWSQIFSKYLSAQVPYWLYLYPLVELSVSFFNQKLNLWIFLKWGRRSLSTRLQSIKSFSLQISGYILRLSTLRIRFASLNKYSQMMLVGHKWDDGRYEDRLFQLLCHPYLFLTVSLLQGSLVVISLQLCWPISKFHTTILCCINRRTTISCALVHGALTVGSVCRNKQ